MSEHLEEYFYLYLYTVAFLLIGAGFGMIKIANKIIDNKGDPPICPVQIVNDAVPLECPVATSTPRAMTDEELLQACIVRDNDLLDWYQFTECPRIQTGWDLEKEKIVDLEKELKTKEGFISPTECASYE